MVAGCADLEVDGRLRIGEGALSAVRNVKVDGKLDGGAGTLVFSGDFAVSGAFDARSGTVENVDGCGVGESTFTGDAVFNRLSVTTATGRMVRFASGDSLRVRSDLRLTGVEGDRLRLGSTRTGAPAFFDLFRGARQLVQWMEVRDVWATGQPLANGPSSSFDSRSAGNTLGWFGVEFLARQVPVGNPVLLVLTVLGAGVFVLRRGGIGMRR